MRDPGLPAAQIEEYRLIRPLGHGAMGQVYLAQDTLLSRLVALKFIHAAAPSSAARERFYVEARAVARLCHPNVVSIHRVGEHEGRPYLVSEYVRGTGLNQLPRPMPWEQVLKVGIGLARGLAAAHRRGVLHRDIKPANVVLSEEGEVKLLDFGLAKILFEEEGEAGGLAPSPSPSPSGPGHGPPQATAETLTMDAPAPPAASAPPQPPSMTATGTLLGTPRYMAPELWQDAMATRQSDVFAVGAVLYELASGRPLYQAGTLEQLRELVRHAEPAPLHEIAEGADPRLCAVIHRCLLRDPAARFASAEGLREALEALALAAPAPGLALPADEPYRGLRPFEEAHAALFFGRAAEVRAILEQLRTEPLTLVAGDSGVGKSSLCRSGVLPVLQAGPYRGAVARMVPGRSPLGALAAALSPLMDLEESLCKEGLRTDPGGLSRQLRRQRSGGGLLFIDQMEELLTLSDPAEAAAVGEALQVLLRGESGLRLLATARGDFVTRLAALPGLGPDLPRALFVLGPLSPGGLREAITGPARSLGYAFESDAMVDALAEAGAALGGLPLLQFTLTLLWGRRDEVRRVIPRAALDDLGGVAGALARHADGVLDALLPAQRAAARRVLGKLVTPDGTRARRGEGELLGPDDADGRAALMALVSGRLVLARADEAGTQGCYELAHEALVTGWGTLRAWLAQDAEQRLLRERLARAAAEWRRLSRAPSALWQGAQLDEVAALEPATLLPGEAAFLTASRGAARRGRLQRRGLLLSAPLGLLLLYGGARLQAERALTQRVRAHLSAASAAQEQAGRLLGKAEALRGSALAFFDGRRRAEAEPRWTEALQTEEAAAQALSGAERSLEAALVLDSSRGQVRELMAQVLARRARLPGTAQREREALLIRLGLYDPDGSLRRGLIAPATLAVASEPAGAAVSVQAYEQVDGLRRLLPARALGSAPVEVTLAPGSYLLTLSLPGRVAARYPVLLRNGVRERVMVPLPRQGAVPPGFVYVPAGRFLLGSGDEVLRREFFDTVPQHEAGTAAFLIAQDETTYGDWLRFLRALPADERARRLPRSAAAGFHGSLALVELPDGRYQLTQQPTTRPYVVAEGELLRYEGRAADGARAQDFRRFPVTGISWDDALAYVAWLGAAGHPGRVPGARLCTEAEWERAARGADDRLFPHGDRLRPGDANFDAAYGKQPEAFGPDEVGAHPASRSPFGVDDLAGNAFEWVRATLSARQAVVRGGSYYHSERTAAAVNRAEPEPAARDPRVGLRVCADLGDG